MADLNTAVEAIRRLAQQYEGMALAADAPVLVAGDFNDWGALLAQPMARVGLRSGSPVQAATFPSRLPLVQFDHIFVRGMRALSQQAHWLPTCSRATCSGWPQPKLRAWRYRPCWARGSFSARAPLTRTYRN